ncbi:conditioned medium factor, putative [Acanthamoeba castellanii str. Neff]|uniref:Conditioned medium factor, putative n=1 Tax=Acanthamoeba castellanii (strain ATCC 30010 / Neff) TaxID=1257118 RepID=L8HKD6_ACACF|nr:conditioned medium factor, putative [Acanthamoeba castellanii str. Neff]ELR25113.1 conditioned medium factor, putative [Acanthamoeba castellanii str. Neff]
MKFFILLALALVATSCLAIKPPSDEFRKKLQGPPSEFAQHRIPKPELAALNSESSWHELTFSKADDGTFVWKGEMVVDSKVELDISVFSPYEDNMDIIVQPPNELPLSINVALATSALWAERAAAGIGKEYELPFTKTSGPFGIDGASYPVTTYSFKNPTVGTWTATLVIKGVADVATDKPTAVVMITNKASVKLFSHLNKYELEVGQEVGLVANIHNAEGELYLQGRPGVLQLASASTVMSVRLPDGRKIDVPMHDDGVHADLAPNDGIYGAVIEALAPGQYMAQSVFKGVTVDGVAFERSTEHSFHVVNPYITLTGLADVEYNAKEKFFYFHIDVDSYDVDSEESTTKAYAEVWGTDSTGYEYAPVAWVQAMVDPYKSAAGETVVTLQLHEDWVHKAGVTAPFQLRNVWLEDRNWNVVLSERSAIYVDASAIKSFQANPHKRDNVAITEEMTVGPRPAAMALRNRTRASEAGGKLILVHGYCAGQNEFPLSDFTNAVQFQDYNQVRSNDAFALKIRDFGNQFDSFSIGGLAATHLHAYYWSNLEAAKGGRLIQSVGSPYYGSGLAGNLAAIGDIFGVGCGKNNDLTYDGATKWANALPAGITKDVFYYTTQYKDALFGGYCVFGASLALYSPNDGTTEVVKAKLAGANYAGHKSDWCHTTGMNHPNQCTDPARNKEMDTAASR